MSKTFFFFIAIILSSISFSQTNLFEEQDSTNHQFFLIDANTSEVLPFAEIILNDVSQTTDLIGAFYLSTESSVNTITFTIKSLGEYGQTTETKTVSLDNPENQYRVLHNTRQPGPVIDFSKKQKSRPCSTISGNISRGEKPFFMARVKCYQGAKLLEQSFTDWKGDYSMLICTKKKKIRVVVERNPIFTDEIISKGRLKIPVPHKEYEYNVKL